MKSAHEHASVTAMPDSTVLPNGVVGMLVEDGAPAVGQTLPATPGQFGMFAVPEVAVVFKGSST